MRTSGYRPSRAFFSEKEERELFKEYQTTTDERAKERLYSKIVVNFTPLVFNIQKSLAGYQLSSEDLTQEGMLALSEAAKRYDVTAENRFAAFAYQWIKGVLLAYVIKNFSMVNYCTSASKKSLFFHIRTMVSREQRKQETFQTTSEIIDGIAFKLGVPAKEIQSILGMLSSHWDALDEPVHHDSGMTHLDLIEDETPNHFEKSEHHRHQREVIMEAMAKSRFTERERIIIERQFLKDEDDRATLGDLGTELGVSNERIRQIRNKAYTRLSRYLKNQRSSGKINLTELLSAH